MDFKIRLFYLLILVQVISIPSLVAKGETVTAENKCEWAKMTAEMMLEKCVFYGQKEKCLIKQECI